MPYYVSGTGSDGYTAAQAQNPATPWQTPRQALLSAPSGEIQIRGGTYSRVNCAADVLSKAAELTVRPYPGETPSILGMNLGTASKLTFDGLNFDSYCYFGKFSPSPVLKITDVTVRDCVFDMHNVAYACASIVATTGVLVEGNTFKNAVKPNNTADPADGINVRGFAPTGLIIRNNLFQDLDQDGLTFNISNTDSLVENNVFNRACGSKKFSDGIAHNDAIALYGTGTNMVLRRNTIINSIRGIFVDVAATTIYDDLVVENNVVVPYSADFALRIAGRANGAKIVNNTFWGEVPASPPDVNGSAGGVNISTASSGIVLKNNIIRGHYPVTNDTIYAVKRHNLIAVGTTAGGTDNANNVQGSPSFNDAANDDYRLAAGDTLAKNQGDQTLTNVPAVDRDGYTRPSGARYDIGAYEYATGPGLSLSDTVTVADGVAKAAAKTMFDTVGVEDALAKAFAKPLVEVALLTDDVFVAETDAGELPVTVSDTVTVSDSVGKSVGKGLVE